MTELVPAGLRRQRAASILLAIAFLVLELVWFLCLGFCLLLAVRWTEPAARLWTGLSLAGLLANTWGLARAVKNGHFLWLYGRWSPAATGGERGLDQLQMQARQAFVDDDLERVLLLAAKVPAAQQTPDLISGAARSLALLGRLEEAAEAFARRGEEAERLRWLRPRRAWGLDWPVYFKPADARWARRHVWLVALAALCAGGAVYCVDGSVSLAQAHRRDAFERDGFLAQQEGPFTFYYHDPAFRDQVAELAEAALAKELAFLNREAASIPPGAFRLYLCEDREEYLRRSPYSPSWEQASALPVLESIYIHKLPPEQSIYFSAVLAHELSHLLYHRFFPVKGNDAWLNEGLADHLGYSFALDRAGFARQQWLREHRFADLARHSLPFDRFFQTDPHSLADKDVETFYRQGFSLVFMLVEYYGQADFLRFLDAYRRNGGQATAALAQVYPSIAGTQDLAAVWGLFYGGAQQK